jgi:hypothetical protein
MHLTMTTRAKPSLDGWSLTIRALHPVPAHDRRPAMFHAHFSTENGSTAILSGTQVEWAHLLEDIADALDPHGAPGTDL